jgi:hypothetical protein
MAVVQISRIQVRRGKAQTGTGFPQLASGEMGWAIDTQELYIGNGAVAEGSPAVGNTKILTQNDLSAEGNLLQQLQHIYKSGDGNLCGTPALATNHARLQGVTVAGCVNCSKEYSELMEHQYWMDKQEDLMEG